MRIGINLLFLIPGKVGGTETFTRGVVDALSVYDRDNSYVLFCNKENFETFRESGSIKKVMLPVPASNKPFRIIFEQLFFWYYVYKYKIELLHSFGYISPFFVPCRSVVNIFDLNWYYHPEDFGLVERNIWKFLVSNSAKFADSITTSSYSSKKSIKKILNVNKSINVIYPGLFELSPPGNFKIIEEIGVRKPYFFSLSAAYPHKNLMGLLKSFTKVLERGYDAQLVIAGLGGRSLPAVESYIKKTKLEEKVKIIGWVEGKIMSTLYKYSLAFVFTSFYEGFGVPILECFRLGVPIISSNAFSLNEVIGNGGVKLDPKDEAKFSDEMVKVLTNKNYREKLVFLSKKRGPAFNWEKTVLSLKRVYK